MWVVHGIVLYRCAPEQLRNATKQAQDLDEFMSTNMTPSELLRDMPTNMNYVSGDVQALPADHEIHDEHLEGLGPRESPDLAVARRITGKRAPPSHDLPESSTQGEMNAKETMRKAVTLQERMAAARDIDLKELGLQTQTEGKYSGKKYSEILNTDPAYTAWLSEHHSSNGRFIGLLEFSRRCQEQKTGKVISLEPSRDKAAKKKNSIAKSSRNTAPENASGNEWLDVEAMSDPWPTLEDHPVIMEIRQQIADLSSSVGDAKSRRRAK